MERAFLEIKYIDKKIKYDGSQLAPHWIYKSTGIMGDAAVAFCGPCNIPYDNMADLEDVLDSSSIKADSMLHFICELFGKDCFTAVAVQNAFVSEMQNALLKKGVYVSKIGDDLFVGKGKLSISIATVSTVSALIHVGLNIENKGTPVVTAALKDFSIKPEDLAKDVLKRLNKEYSRMILASCKVRPRI